MREVHQKSHAVALKNVLCGLFFVSNGELDYLLTTFCGVFRLAGKILVQFISDMERVFLFQMSINIGGDLNATVTHAPRSIIYQRHQRYILNPDFRRIADTIIDTAPGEFPGRGMPLGVEPSQQEMAAMPSAVDNWIKFTTSIGHFDQLVLGAPFSPHGFPAPFRRRFPALPCEGSSPGIPSRRSCGFQGAVLNLAIKNHHTTT